jgi:hypothetical protein
VQARGERDAVAPGMERDGQAARLRQGGDADDLADAAGACDVGLQDVDRAARDKLLEVVAGVKILAQRDGDLYRRF